MKDITVPAHLRVLGSETERLHELLVARLDEPWPCVVSADMSLPDAGSKLMYRLEAGLRSLTGVLNGPLRIEAARTDGSETVMLRVVGRLEQALEQLLMIHDDARDLPADAAYDYPKQLLLDGLRDILFQVDAVLVRLADMIANPEVFAEPDMERDGNRLELPLNLVLQAPEAFDELAQLWQDTGIEAEYPGKRRRWWGIAGAVVLGALLGGGLFGDGCD